MQVAISPWKHLETVSVPSKEAPCVRVWLAQEGGKGDMQMSAYVLVQEQDGAPLMFGVRNLITLLSEAGWGTYSHQRCIFHGFIN